MRELTREEKAAIRSLVVKWCANYDREYGYKACASLTKLGERYGRERLENACGQILAYSTTPSIRNISSLLKNGQDRPVKAVEPDRSAASNRFGITRGASYFRKGGER